MCGIFAFITKNKFFIDKFFLKKEPENKNIKYDHLENDYLDKLFYLSKSRGPDVSNVKIFEVGNTWFYIGFNRLSIVDTNESGNQPFYLENKLYKYVLICNGEIYNYKELIEKFNLTKDKGDCYCILELYIKFGIETLLNLIEGEYSFIIIEYNNYINSYKIIASRDLYGIRAMHYGITEETIVISSELKSINPITIGHVFPPRNYFTCIDMDKYAFKTYYNLAEFPYTSNMISDLDKIYSDINSLFRKSVLKRLQCDDDVEIGCLLSGGLDSSLVSALTSDFLNKKGKKLKTFSIGFENSEDIKYAKIVSEYIGSEHYEIIKTEQDFLNEIENVVYITETYDITTIRASIGQYLVSKFVKENTNVKVLLIGDGSDELFNGYKYNYLNENPIEAHYDTLRLLNEIHLYDVLRSDRGVSSNGLEARVPFLDKKFVEYVLTIDPKLRMPIKNERIEKYILRKSFEKDNILPNEVLFRNKEAFSDAVSNVNKKLWYQVLKEHIENLDFQRKKYEYLPPIDKESEYYRFLFEKHYPNNFNILHHFWMPNWINVNNPSAKIINV